ncbi:hypothetical protein AgCh_022069 [Apium graveolens]
MYYFAEQFLTLSAFGAPPIVIALAAQGTFRGFKDTKTLLYVVGAGNLLNSLLDPVLIFLLGLGIGGAAISTVISEYMIPVILLWKLNDKVSLISPKFESTKFFQYLKSVELSYWVGVFILCWIRPFQQQQCLCRNFRLCGRRKMKI